MMNPFLSYLRVVQELMDTDASPSPSDLHTYNSESALMSSQLEIEMSEEKVEDGELTGVLEKTTSEDTKIKEKTDNAPKLPFIVLFAKFLWFGCRAFGGPVAQINLMKQELVDEEHWISKERFNLIYGVYQIVPGPEAYELACYFGMISRGYIGALLGGFGFALPGVLLELFFSYFYVKYGVSNNRVSASFTCVQLAVAAMIFRAIYKLAEHMLVDHESKAFVWDRGFIFLFNFLTATIGLNFFASLAISGIINLLFEAPVYRKIKWGFYAAYFVAAGTIAFFFVYVAYNGQPSNNILGDSSAGAESGTDFGSLFVLGLIAGCVSFGGAYTTIPFVYNIAVIQGAYVTNQQFLDALAICNMLPAPLVSFVATIGFIGHGVLGAILMLIGIFLPATIFPILGHELLQKMVENRIVQPFLDGVSAAVLGLLLQTAFNFMKGVVLSGLNAAVFGMSFLALFYFTNKFTPPILIIVAAIAGQTLFT